MTSLPLIATALTETDVPPTVTANVVVAGTTLALIAWSNVIVSVLPLTEALDGDAA